MTNVAKLVAAAAVVLMCAAQAGAATLSWSANLTQEQEVPTPVSVPGAGGSANGTIDTLTGLVNWTITWAGLSGPALGLHFHANALPGATATVAINIGALNGLDTPNVGSATIPTMGQVQNFVDGLYYINLHTAVNPAGEIRGQVTVAPIPLPAAAPLMLSGIAALAGVAALRRRRAARG